MSGPETDASVADSPSPSAGHLRRHWRGYLVAVGALLLATLLVWVEARDTARPAWLAILRWLDTFVRSPGLGGLAAVLAASVGLSQWRRQKNADRYALRDQHWWDVYKLLYPATLGLDDPPSAEDLTLLDTLAQTADTEVQVAAAAVVARDYQRRKGDPGAE